ncbi:MAG: HAD family hydrolase [Demequinaceae bacterium]|nr:HAD family hydrolase [Demequinaceae bacterium]
MIDRPISGVLVDIDDTLLDNKSAVRHAISRIAAAYLPSHTDIDEAAAFFRADRNGHYRAFSRGEIDSRTQRRLRAEDLHAHFGGPVFEDEDAVVAWITAFDDAYREGWALHDDALPFLAALDDLGLPYGVLSNARRAQQVAKLAAVGLSHVPLLVCVDDFGFGKPDPRVFEEACRLLGTAPGETLYVGDEFDIDAAAAVRASLVGVWCDRPGAWERRTDEEVAEAGVVRVGSLTELAGLLRSPST